MQIQQRTSWSGLLQLRSYLQKSARLDRRQGDWGSVYLYVRRYLPFNIALATIIGIMVDVIFREIETLRITLVFCYSIMGSLFALMLVLRVFVMQRYSLSPLLTILAHAAVVAVGYLVGVELAERSLGKFDENWRTTLWFSFMGASISILHLESVERGARAKQAERMALAAQLQVLQAQIEPHFLFNTLAGLSELIATDAARAQQMLGHLNHYLRASLAHARSGTATLATEFTLLRAYLGIMQMRLPNRLRSSVECADNCANLPFAPMLVQPLVENAVTHGIEPRREGGEVRVHARSVETTLVVTVEDSGVGLHAAGMHGTSLGLRTIRERLHALFGTAASLEVTCLAPHGTRAQITIPLALLARSE